MTLYSNLSAPGKVPSTPGADVSITVRVTRAVAKGPSVPAEVTRMEPVYVPGANPVGSTETLRSPTVGPTTPLMGVTASHRVVVTAAYGRVSPSVLGEKICVGGSGPPGVYANDRLAGASGGGVMIDVATSTFKVKG